MKTQITLTPQEVAEAVVDRLLKMGKRLADSKQCSFLMEANGSSAKFIGVSVEIEPE